MNKPQPILKALLLFAAMTLQSCASLSKPDICNERSGRAAMVTKNYDVAYEHLKGCESLEKASGEAFSQLAFLTTNGYGAFESDKVRHTKYYEFVHRAAIKLDPGAIETLIGFYKDGDEIVPQEPRLIVAQCLAALLDSGQGNRRQVLTCLAL